MGFHLDGVGVAAGAVERIWPTVDEIATGSYRQAMTAKWRLVAFATVVLVLSALGGPAYAAYVDNRVGNARYRHDCSDSSQASPHYVCRTDNGAVSWWIEGRPIDTTGSPSDTPVELAINQSTVYDFNNPTDLSMAYDTTPKTSGSGETDIVYRSRPGDFVTSDDGYTFCDDAAAGNECDQQYVNFRYTSTTRALVCHETGHAVGLLHGENSDPKVSNRDDRLGCMRKPIYSSEYGLGGNSISSVNNMY